MQLGGPNIGFEVSGAGAHAKKKYYKEYPDQNERSEAPNAAKHRTQRSTERSEHRTQRSTERNEAPNATKHRTQRSTEHSVAPNAAKHRTPCSTERSEAPNTV